MNKNELRRGYNVGTNKTDENTYSYYKVEFRWSAKIRV